MQLQKARLSYLSWVLSVLLIAIKITSPMQVGEGKDVDFCISLGIVKGKIPPCSHNNKEGTIDMKGCNLALNPRLIPVNFHGLLTPVPLLF